MVTFLVGSVSYTYSLTVKQHEICAAARRRKPAQCWSEHVLCSPSPATQQQRGSAWERQRLSRQEDASKPLLLELLKDFLAAKQAHSKRNHFRSAYLQSHPWAATAENKLQVPRLL